MTLRLFFTQLLCAVFLVPTIFTTGHCQNAEAALANQLEQFLTHSPLAEDRKEKMVTMSLAAYRANDFKPLWGKFTQLEDVPAYMQIIKNHGLVPEDLKLLLPSKRNSKGAGSERFSLTEVYKTLWLAEVCLLLREGTPVMNQRVRWSTWMMGEEPGAVSLASPRFIDQLSDAFARAIISGVTLTSRLEKLFAPQNPIYQGLQKNYIDLFHDTPLIDEDQPAEFYKGPALFIEKSIKKGDRFFRAKELGNYLFQQGYLSAEDLQGISVIYSGEIQEAMAKFQQSRGLPADGVLDPETAELISKGSKPNKVKQTATNVNKTTLLINLNRARQLPQDLGPRYIIINLPTAELHAFEGVNKIYTGEILVGSPELGKQTPILRSQIEKVVLKPYWLLSPNSAYDHLPKIRQQYSHLKWNGFQIVDRAGNVQQYDANNLDRIQAGELFLRQKAGNNNALGSVLYHFPNFRFIDCYATTWTDLFKKPSRAVTKGRIAMQRSDKLTAWLLSENTDQEWSEPKLTATIQSSGENNEIKLAKPVPIYLIYLTALPGETEPVIIPDIYKMDR